MSTASPAGEQRFLVTGAFGCIGVWILRELLARGAVVVASDLATDSSRLGLILDDEHDDRLQRAVLDVTDMTQFRAGHRSACHHPDHSPRGPPSAGLPG